jgi:hypothetical protein
VNAKKVRAEERTMSQLDHAIKTRLYKEGGLWKGSSYDKDINLYIFDDIGHESLMEEIRHLSQSNQV